MSNIIKKATIIVAAGIIIAAVVMLFILRPWSVVCVNETVVTDVRAVRDSDGRIYVYGNEEERDGFGGEYAKSPYGELHCVTDDIQSIPSSYKCLAIIDVEGGVQLQSSDYEYINTLLSDKEWWAENIGFKSAGIPKRISIKLPAQVTYILSQI